MHTLPTERRGTGGRVERISWRPSSGLVGVRSVEENALFAASTELELLKLLSISDR